MKLKSVALLLCASLSLLATGAAESISASISGPSSTTVKFSTNSQFISYVPAIINGKNVFLSIDTGAGGTVIDLSFARELGLKPKEAGDVATTIVGTGQKRYVARIDIQIGNIKIMNYRVSCLDMSYFKNLTNPALSGILGGDLLGATRATIAYGDSTLKLFRPRRK